MKTHPHTPLICLLSISLMLAISGCTQGPYAEGVETGTVKGKVTYNNEPAPEGTIITFLSEGGTGVPAGATVAADGSITLRAKGTLDIPTGVYKVIVAPPPQPEMTPEEAMEKSVAGTLNAEDTSNIPQKYRNVETTPEIFEVKVGENTYTLDMKD